MKMSVVEMIKKDMREKADMEERMARVCGRLEHRASIVIPRRLTRPAGPFAIPNATIALGVSPRSHRKALYSVSTAGIRERRVMEGMFK